MGKKDLRLKRFWGGQRGFGVRKGDLGCTKEDLGWEKGIWRGELGWQREILGWEKGFGSHKRFGVGKGFGVERYFGVGKT